MQDPNGSYTSPVQEHFNVDILFSTFQSWNYRNEFWLFWFIILVILLLPSYRGARGHHEPGNLKLGGSEFGTAKTI
jgi:hypothetical protein